MRETVARIMVELFSNDLAIQYNMNGQKGKMSFGKLHLANVMLARLSPNVVQYCGKNLKESDKWKLIASDKFMIFYVNQLP